MIILMRRIIMTAMISRSEGMHKTSEIFWMTTLIDQLIIRRDQCGNDGDERVKYYAEENGHYVEYTKLGIAKTLECQNFAGYI